jgi:SAM-dependent methyltransferase
MKQSYTQSELDNLIVNVSARSGWDFSSMNVTRAPVSWEYLDEVRKLLKPTDHLLDIGTGGGELFLQLADNIAYGLGTDIDPTMIDIAEKNANGLSYVSFRVSDNTLKNIDEQFDVITNRHAPLDIDAIKSHLKTDGTFITQQVGEKNMMNIKEVLNLTSQEATVSKDVLESEGMHCIGFYEYNVEYLVKDIESLIFWLNALDMLHSDISGADAIKNVDVLNTILDGNVTEHGFVTNEHRYLVVAKLVH